MSNPTGLTRSIGLRLAVIIVMANIIGSGVYKKVAPMMNELQSPGWVLLCWLLGGIVTLLGALCSAELAGMLASTGGEYNYYRKIYGRFFSFLYGWSNFAAIKSAAIAGISYVFAQSLNSIVPLPVLFASLQDVNIGGIFYPFLDFNTKFAAILLVVALTWLNSKGLKTGAGLSSVLLLLILAGIALIVVFGLSSKEADISAALQLAPAATDKDYISISTIFTAMLAAFWAYEGWNTMGFLGGEVKNPHRNVPRGIVIGLFILITVYLLANLTYMSLLSPSELTGVFNNNTSIAAVEAVRVFWGSTGVGLMSFIILVSTLGCTHATIYGNARTYYAMSQEGVFFKTAGKLNKAGVPSNSLILQGIWACILILSGSFDQLTDMLIFAAFIYYGATALGVIILRHRMPDAHRPYKVWGYPVIPVLFILFCIVLVANTIIERPREAGVGLTLIFMGVPFYWWFMRKSKQ